ncbi:MAG: hypothetical protein COS15_02960 [Caldiserica bacterium CG02_land_8_20_14_3_00_36_38]|nr:MAG: hypothetical protein COS15_02960 [Caldiserica bacterium CG02_land_8_20_14_3_00_36_38]
MKNKVEAIYCDCFQTFVVRENFFERDTDKFLAEILPRVSQMYATCTKTCNFLKKCSLKKEC